MKKSILTFAFLSLFSLLLADWVEFAGNQPLFTAVAESAARTELFFVLDGFERETVTENGVKYEKITYQNEGHFLEVGKPALPRFSRLIAIPNTGEVSIDVNIISRQVLEDFRVYPSQELQSESEINPAEFIIDNEFYAGSSVFPALVAEVDEPAILRDYRLVNVTINPFQYDPVSNELHIIREAEIQVNCDKGIGENIKSRIRKPSRFFEQLYRSSILNFADVALREDGYQKPCYLFIYDDEAGVLDVLQYLLDWKHEKGFEVHLAGLSEIGSSLNEIKAYIQNAYDVWENPPEFVCLVGDAGGTFNVPTGHLDGGYYNGEGDQIYTLLEGDDILADVFLGRLSFNTILQFQTIVSKILNYEREPYLSVTDWYNQVLLVGDPTHSGPSTIDTKLNVHDMIALNDPQMNITEVYDTGSGSWVNQMTANINSGVSYFNYRGFAGMSGMEVYHINQLNNGNMLPVAVFVTCITGDFEGTIDCRSEAFLKAGTPTNPKGAIAAIATATGNTHTCFNNCVDAGIYFGIFSDKIYHMGGALNRGKLTLYQNYPGNPGNHVNQFSYWNNLMGDPGMAIWTDVPQQMTVNFADTVPLGSNYVEFNIQDSAGNPLANAWVTILQGEDAVFETGFTDSSGNIILSLPDAAVGEVQLTVTSHNFIPFFADFSIQQAAGFVSVFDFSIDDDDLGSSCGNGDGIINPGEIIELAVTLKNNGTQTAPGVTAIIADACGFVSILDSTETFGSIPAAGTAVSADDFDFQFAASTLASDDLKLEITISESSGLSWSEYIDLPFCAAELSFQDYIIADGNNGILFPGETAFLQISLQNGGSLSAADIQAEISCDNPFLCIMDSLGSFGDLMPDSIAINSADPFMINALAVANPGSAVDFSLHLYNSAGYDDIVFFSIEIGQLQESDPLGPDEFGYYCYDDGDAQYLEVPQYQWIEIDPAQGGSGTNLGLQDFGNQGDTALIDLPFPLTFYDQTYLNLTICSNGWMAPGETASQSFMNWSIPGPLGPSPLIAPFWDDLVLVNGNVFYQYLPNLHCLVVQWSHAQNEYNGMEETFEAIIYDHDFYPAAHENNLIKFQYQVVNNVDQGLYAAPVVGHGQYATVGIEDHTGTIGLEYSYNNEYPITAKPLENEMAIIFAGEPQQHIEPYIVLGEIIISDENGNGLIEFGEEVGLEIFLNNVGQNTTVNVQAELLVSDPYITLLSNQSNYSTINGMSSASNQTDFVFEVADNCPHNHPIFFQLNVSSNEDNWILFFSLSSTAPAIQIANITFEDGNNNIFDPGENGQTLLEIINSGGSTAAGMWIDVTSSDPFVSFAAGGFAIGDLQPGETAMLSVSTQIDLNAPIQHEAFAFLDISMSSGFSDSLQFSLFIAQVPVLFQENFDYFLSHGWTIQNSGAAGTGWQLNPSNAAGGITPEAACICLNSEEYNDFLISPIINTLGSIELNLQFRSAVYENLRNYLISVQTTADGENWHTVWSQAGQNYNPHIENLILSSSDVGSAAFQFAFVLNGQPSSIIGWVIDDIQLTEVTTVAHGYVSGYVSLNGGSGTPENVLISAAGISRNPAANGFFCLPLPQGIYDITAALPGYVSQTVESVSITNWQTVNLDFMLPEISINYPPANLTAEALYNDVVLDWDMPGTDISRVSKTIRKAGSLNRERSFLGYNVYRNNVLQSQISNIQNTEFEDTGLDAGDYSYYVTAVYDEGESEPSNIEMVTITLSPPLDLTAQITGPGMVLLQWDAPAPSARGFQNYRVYRDSNLLVDNILQTFYFNTNVPSGWHVYDVTCVYDGYESEPATVNVEVTEIGNNLIPLHTELLGNHPNPFNPTTQISFALQAESHIRIDIFNLKGEKVKTLVNEALPPARHAIWWDGKDDAGKSVSSGIYFYRMQTSDYCATRKMILMK